MNVPDSIARAVILAMRRARVWAALTQAPRLGAWLGTRASVDLRPRGELGVLVDYLAAHA